MKGSAQCSAERGVALLPIRDKIKYIHVLAALQR